MSPVIDTLQKAMAKMFMDCNTDNGGHQTAKQALNFFDTFSKS